MTQVCYRGVDFLYTTMYFDWFISVVNFASKRLPSELNASVIKLLGVGLRKRLEFGADPGWWWFQTQDWHPLKFC